MPAGLDGNPNPVVTADRSAVIEQIVQVIIARKVANEPLLVAIDGIDGSGKSTFADEVSAVLRASKHVVVRASIDSFHHPRSTRWKRGPTSPVGFYLDSHNLDDLRDVLLEPFARGRGEYVVEIFDEPSDQPVTRPAQTVDGQAILLFDGIFAQRDELADYWNLTIYLQAQQRVDLRRLGYVLDALPADAIDVVAHVLEWQRKIDRYSSGMRYYVDLVDPEGQADIVIDNNDLARPVVVKTS